MDIEYIKQLCLDGKSAKTIANILNVEYMKIYRIIKRNGFPLNSDLWYDDNTINEIKNYLLSGKTYKEIGLIYGKEDFNILSIAKKFGFKSENRKKLSEEEKTKILEMHQQGLFLCEMEDILQRPDSTISQFLLTQGLETDIGEKRRINKELAAYGKRICGGCKRELFRKDFFNRICKECARSNGRKNYKIYKEKMTIERFARLKVKNAKSRAKTKNINFDFTVEDFLKLYIKQNGNCFYSGLPMSINIDDNRIMSIDRINSDLGYTKDNCVLTIRVVNIMKNNLSFSEFIKMCQIISNNHNER